MNNDKYDLHDVLYGVQGWDGIMAADMQIINDQMPTRILGILGETVVAYQPLYFDPADSKWYKAQADGLKQPAHGISVESGDEDDEIRIHRMGEITNVLWAWAIGLPIYLDPDTPGALTQMPPTTYRQLIGYALSATKMLTIIQAQVQRVDLPIYTNNLDALAGGLEVGDFYRSGGDPDIVYVVHAGSTS